jgi:hypothetical protein
MTEDLVRKERQKREAMERDQARDQKRSTQK